MDDEIDYEKAYDSRKDAAGKLPPKEPTAREKQLLILKAQAEKAQGQERAAIEEKIRRLSSDEPKQ